MQNEMKTFTPKTDIAAVEAACENCLVSIAGTDGPMQVRASGGVNIFTRDGGTRLIIKQKSTFLSRLTGRAGRIEIFIPGHIVPDVSIKGGRTDCTIQRCMLGAAEFNFSGSVSACDCCMESCAAILAQGDVKFDGCTIKGSLALSCGCGDAAVERSLATHAACRVKKGNIGLAAFNCRDTILETAEGNITAEIVGRESDFDLDLTAREGTCNKQTTNAEGNTGCLKAYSQRGSIYIEFNDEQEVIA